MGCGASKEAPTLLEAAGEGNVQACRAALAKGANPSMRDEHGATPLHYAVEMGACDAARRLAAARAWNWEPQIGGATAFPQC